MGSARDKFKDFAVAFWKTSKKDLERAQDALKEEYPIRCFTANNALKKL